MTRLRQGSGAARSLPALILTAGLATRLRPLSLLRAKAALPVAKFALAGADVALHAPIRQRLPVGGGYG